MKVKDVMTTEVVTARPDASLKEVAALLAARGISGVPVVSETGEVLGVVSEADVLLKESGEPAPRGLLARLLDPNGELGTKLAAVTAREAMTAPAVTIGPGRPVAEAATRMIDNAVNRLPVVADGKLVGIVTRADLVRAFTRSDEEIETEIRDEIVLRTLWMSPEAIEIRVREGAVTLAGEVENEGVAEVLPAFARRVPGVVSVDAHLSWRG